MSIACLSDASVMGGIVVVLTSNFPASSRKKSILAVLVRVMSKVYRSNIGGSSPCSGNQSAYLW